jgi:hypothetical protein
MVAKVIVAGQQVYAGYVYGDSTWPESRVRGRYDGYPGSGPTGWRREGALIGLQHNIGIGGACVVAVYG